MEKLTPTVGALYGGIGGALLGAKRAGYKVDFNIESRAFFNIETFNHNFPGAVHHSSVFDAPAAHTNLLIGSPDCKQFSNLGTKRRDRGKLHKLDIEAFDYFIFLKFVLEAKPDNFILENVPNVLKTLWFEGNALRFSGSNDVALVMEHYNIQTVKLNALDFGVPQSRKRVFVIGSKHFLPQFDLKTLKESAYISLFERWKVGSKIKEAFNNLAGKPNTKKPKHSLKRIEGFRRLKIGDSYYGTQNNKRLDPDKHSGVVASHCSRFVHPYESRVLNVRECARLMGFPDYFIFFGTESGQLDQVGKSIVPQISTALSYYIKQQNKHD
jgi:DNA (cytosine-5)-methyltransferase 1